jgi:16S rRNA (guanine(1405)-N(7))-methyltransferase
MPDLNQIVSAVSSSKKYHSLCEDTICRVALLELEVAPHASLKAAIKGTKRRLHQIYGAFEQTFDYDKAYERLESAYSSGSQEEIEATCRRILEQHTSTQERLPELEQFYDSIFRTTGKPTSILDLGCGLNPLAIPWMRIGTDARYIALDIDGLRVQFLNRYLALSGLEPLARCQDLLVHPPDDRADLALLLKMSPTLERQARGSTQRLIEGLATPMIVVSYAIRSLGGQGKGMLGNYQQQFLHVVEGRQWPVTKLVFDRELVFVVRRQVR